MKLKHWSGYGCVNAKKVSSSPHTLVVEVKGMHERGLETDDTYHVFNWLVRRFDKTRKDWLEISNLHTAVTYTADKNGFYNETCIYTIVFK